MLVGVTVDIGESLPVGVHNLEAAIYGFKAQQKRSLMIGRS